MPARRKQVTFTFTVICKSEQEAREFAAIAAVLERLPNNKLTASLRSLIHLSKCERERQALMILFLNPDLKNCEIARCLGISKSYVSKFGPSLDRYRTLHNQLADIPRGSKNGKGVLESWEESAHGEH